MGGGFFEGGNATPAAEFNIYVDPHAAESYSDAGVPIVMMPIDVTWTNGAMFGPKAVDKYLVPDGADIPPEAMRPSALGERLVAAVRHANGLAIDDIAVVCFGRVLPDGGGPMSTRRHDPR